MVEEIKVDQVEEASIWGDGEIKGGCQRPPELKKKTTKKTKGMRTRGGSQIIHFQPSLSVLIDLSRQRSEQHGV